MTKTVFFLALFLWASFARIDVYGQSFDVVHQNQHHQKVEITLCQGINTITTGFKYTGISFQFNTALALVIELNNKLEPILPNHEISFDDQPLAMSQLYMPTSPQYVIVLRNNNQEAVTVIAHLIYAPPLHLALPSTVYALQGCVEPPSIEQSVWRAGLALPLPGATTTQVEHVIVHHSAGSNTDTNYTNIVRNIYLYHTQSNGWDDVGYNYLIAQNGIIYKGRDPQGAGDQDNVKGAHFCAKNSNTMGICLLGNYELVAPNTLTIDALKLLITWKLYKEQLWPFDTYLHPIGDPNALALPVVVGHQDGCATACPGDSVYQLLTLIKTQVQQELALCSFPASSHHNLEAYAPSIETGAYGTVRVFFNNEAFDLVEINNILGETVYKAITTGKNAVTIEHLPTGLYVLRAWSNDHSRSHKFIIAY